MKASAKKSSTTTSTIATQAANQPFFTKANGGNFFAPATGTATPAVQTKMTVNEPGDKFEQEEGVSIESDPVGFGVAGSGGSLPHLGTIERSFGHHDVSGVRAHVGGAAAEASAAIGARAYATGDDVAFSSAPDLRQATHEAAHVVQQRGGVRLDGGIGHAGDPYERHADAVADQVVRGQSAEALLDTMAHRGSGGGRAVQREDRNVDGIDDETGLPAGGGAGATPASRLPADQHIALVGPDNALEILARRQWLIEIAHVPEGTARVSGASHAQLFQEIVDLLVARYTWANRESTMRHIPDMYLRFGSWTGDELTFYIEHSIYQYIGLPPDAPIQAFRDNGGLTVYADLRHLYPEGVIDSAPATEEERRGVAELMASAFEREVGSPMLTARHGQFVLHLIHEIISLRDTQSWHLSSDDLIDVFGDDAARAYLGRAAAGDPGSAVLQLGDHSYVLPSNISPQDLEMVRRMLAEIHGTRPTAGESGGEPLTARDVEVLRQLDSDPDPDRADIMALLRAAVTRGQSAPPRPEDEPEPFVHETGLASMIETAREMLERQRAGERLHLPVETTATTEGPHVARPVRGEIVNRTGRINTGIETHFAFQTFDRVPILAVPHVNIDWYTYLDDGDNLTQFHSSSTSDSTDFFADVDDYTVTFSRSGIYEIHAFVNHSFYYPAHFQISVDVLTQDERLEQQEEETAESYGRLGDDAERYTFTEIDREDTATSIAVAAGLTVVGVPGPTMGLLTLSDNAIGTRGTGTLAEGRTAGATMRTEVLQINTQIDRLSRLIETLPEGDPTRAAAEARIHRLEAARIAIESGRVDSTAHSIELQGFFATRTEHIPDSALRLTAVFRRNAEGKFSGEMWDTTEHQRAETFHFTSSGHSTYESLMEALFIDLTRAYADGTISFSFQDYEPVGEGTGVRATRNFVRYTRVTDTLAEDIRDIVYSTPVQVAVGIGSILLMLFPPTAPIGIGVSFFYNAGQVAWDLNSDLNTDTLDRGNSIDVGLLIVDLIPLLGRATRIARVGSRAYWTLEIIGDVGDVYQVADSTYREMLLVRDQEAQRVADTYADLEHLRATNAADESGIRALEELLARERQALVDRSYEVLAEAATQQLIMRASHAAVRRLAEPHLSRGRSSDTPDVDTRQPEAETRPPEAETRQPEVEVRPPEAETRQPEVEVRQPEAETRPPETAAVTSSERERFAAAEWERLRSDPDHPYQPSITREEFIAKYAEGLELSPPPNRRWIRPGGRRAGPDHRFTTETPSQVLDHLRNGSFGPFERMLQRLGLVDGADMQARVEAMRTSGRTETAVRHELKSQFRAELMSRLTGLAADGTPVAGHRAEVEARHPELDWVDDPVGAYRAGRHQDFIRATHDIAPADKGNLFEAFNREVHLAGMDSIAHPRIARSEIGGTGPNRVPDHLVPVPSTPDHVILRDDKNLTGPLSEHSQGQMDDYGNLLGRRVEIEVGGQPRSLVVERIVVTFPDPRGVQANRGNIRAQLAKTPEGFTFEVYNWRGESTTIEGPILSANFTDAQLASFLGSELE